MRIKALATIPVVAFTFVAAAPAANAAPVELSAAAVSAGGFFADKTAGKPVSGTVVTPNGTQTFYVDGTGFWIQYGSAGNPKSGPKETCLFDAKGKVSKCSLKQGSQVMDNTSVNKGKTERTVKRDIVIYAVNGVLRSPSGTTVTDATKKPTSISVTSTDPSDASFNGQILVTPKSVIGKSSVGEANIKVVKAQKVKL